MRKRVCIIIHPRPGTSPFPTLSPAPVSTTYNAGSFRNTADLLADLFEVLVAIRTPDNYLSTVSNMEDTWPPRMYNASSGGRNKKPKYRCGCGKPKRKFQLGGLKGEKSISECRAPVMRVLCNGIVVWNPVQYDNRRIRAGAHVLCQRRCCTEGPVRYKQRVNAAALAVLRTVL